MHLLAATYRRTGLSCVLFVMLVVPNCLAVNVRLSSLSAVEPKFVIRLYCYIIGWTYRLFKNANFLTFSNTCLITNKQYSLFFQQ